jgi:adenine/guanine phosphoribosyltransferase-like PRPP-binding protein
MSYLLLEPARLERAIKETTRFLRHKFKFQFTHVAFSGYSGALVAPQVAKRLDKQILVIRKPDENCHSSANLEFVWITPKTTYKRNIYTQTWSLLRYVIIDDFISSGKTIRRIRKTIQQTYRGKTRCVGVIIYHPDWGGSNDSNIKQYWIYQ